MMSRSVGLNLVLLGFAALVAIGSTEPWIKIRSVDSATFLIKVASYSGTSSQRRGERHLGTDHLGARANKRPRLDGRSYDRYRQGSRQLHQVCVHLAQTR